MFSLIIYFLVLITVEMVYKLKLSNYYVNILLILIKFNILISLT